MMWAPRGFPVQVRGTILPETDLRSRPADMGVAVTAAAATPPRHATPAGPARPPGQPTGTPCPSPPDCRGGPHSGVKGACGVAARALRAPVTRAPPA